MTAEFLIDILRAYEPTAFVLSAVVLAGAVVLFVVVGELYAALRWRIVRRRIRRGNFQGGGCVDTARPRERLASQSLLSDVGRRRPPAQDGDGRGSSARPLSVVRGHVARIPSTDAAGDGVRVAPPGPHGDSCYCTTRLVARRPSPGIDGAA